MQGNDNIPPGVSFETSGLFDAAGFKRGDLLKPYYPHLSTSDLRELLATVIERHVLPQLDQDVQVMVIPSARNPVRATRVNGQEVNWPNADAGNGPMITPPTVLVSEHDILNCLPKAKHKPVVVENDDLGAGPAGA